MYKEMSFDENNPNLNNIDLVFSKILFCLTSAYVFEEYFEIHLKIKRALDDFNILLKSYTNSKDLLNINFGKLNEVAKAVSTLDCETVTKEGQYLEMADVWLSILIGYYNLLKEEIKNGKR